MMPMESKSYSSKRERVRSTAPEPSYFLIVR
jgi:hypothetical protein